MSKHPGHLSNIDTRVDTYSRKAITHIEHSDLRKLVLLSISSPASSAFVRACSMTVFVNYYRTTCMLDCL